MFERPRGEVESLAGLVGWRPYGVLIRRKNHLRCRSCIGFLQEGDQKPGPVKLAQDQLRSSIKPWSMCHLVGRAVHFDISFRHRMHVSPTREARADLSTGSSAAYHTSSGHHNGHIRLHRKIVDSVHKYEVNANGFSFNRISTSVLVTHQVCRIF